MSKILFVLGALCLLQLACAGNIKKYENLFAEYQAKFAPFLETKTDDPYTNFVKQEAKSFTENYEPLFNKLATEARACEKADEIVQPIIGKLLERAEEHKVTDLEPGTELFNEKMEEGMTIVARKYTMIRDSLNAAGDDISADLKTTVNQIIELAQNTGKRIAEKKAELRPSA